MPFILGTAGHIDHGKTTLVRALTGIDCDRLGEEKKRGITIELGFAWLDLPDGQRLGIIDVPGHERFVKNMVAGAAGVDLVMLVIAADEGVMPQTREHLEICSLLGIRQGFVVLTKKDMVSPDWLALVEDDVHAFLEGTFLEGCPVLSVSSTTGEGLEALRSLLAQTVSRLPQPHRTDIFRLPIDRVFTLKGYGTIVTGTIVSGHVIRDTDVTIMPRGTLSHVRTLQRHEKDAETAEAGVRCAANLQGVDVQDIERGSTLCLPDTLIPSQRWIIDLQSLASSPIALKHRTEVHFHHGTREISARIYFFDRDALNPGEKALAEIRFPEPMVGVFGDRCVLRSASPLRAVAGGMLVSPVPPEIRQKAPRRGLILEKLAQLPELAGQSGTQADAAFVSAVLAIEGKAGAAHRLLKILTGLTNKRLANAVQELSRRREAVCFDRDEAAYIDAGALLSLENAAVARAEAMHARDALQPGFAKAAIETGWASELSPKLVQKVFEVLLKKGKLVAQGEVLKLPDHEVVLENSQSKLHDAILDACRKGGLTPPNYKDILASIGTTEKQVAPVLRVLVTNRELVRVADGLYYAKEVIDDVIIRVAQWFETHDDLTIAGLKELLGLSRKFLIALLEYLDQEKVTVRIGDKRQLRSR